MPMGRSGLNLSRVRLPYKNTSISTVVASSVCTHATGIGTGSILARQTNAKDKPRTETVEIYLNLLRIF